MKKANATIVQACSISIAISFVVAEASAQQNVVSVDITAVTQEDSPDGGDRTSIPLNVRESILYSFGSDANDGAAPEAGLVQGRDGNLYGTTAGGGELGWGTVFKVTASGVETILHSFIGDLPGVVDGVYPFADLILGKDGNLYGTTVQGGPNQDGTIFKITAAGVETVLHSFGQATGPDGAAPYGALVEDQDGDFYGTTDIGGVNGGGTVFRQNSSGDITVIHSFRVNDSADGAAPTAALIRGSDGHLYGTTNVGGPANAGTVFKITPSGRYSLLYSFGSTGSEDGRLPEAALLEGCDGDLYGTTELGGTNGKGTVFKITRSGIETVLYSFGSTINDGTYPVAPLIRGSDGKFYGTTGSGGSSGNNGTVFRITPRGVETVLYRFASGANGGTDGSGPVGGLIEGKDGDFYGTTLFGGVFRSGAVFKLENVIEKHSDSKEAPADESLSQGRQLHADECVDHRRFN
jgi:uncharacterized repeat protein (TIGR03803 family)